MVDSQDASGATDPLADLFFYAIDEQVLEVQVLEPQQRLAKAPESVIHDIWKQQAFDFSDLRTSHNETIRVYFPGRHNHDAGPDFLDAQIAINGVYWRGDVELHLYSRQWYDHDHHVNPRYNSTILHATLFADAWTGLLKRQDESNIPELVLFPYLRTRLRSLLPAGPNQRSNRLPCHAHWSIVHDDIKAKWINKQALARQDARRELVRQAFLKIPDLEALLHRALFVGLGYAKNSEPMADLSRRIPLSLARTLIDPLDLEAIHFGIAGLLPYDNALFTLDETAADYTMTLRERFISLNKRFDIPPMPGQVWQFFRLRPANFPTIRLAQAVSLMDTGGLLHVDPISRLIECLRQPDAYRQILKLFERTPSSFWQHHYHFKRPSAFHKGTIGVQRLQKLIINAIVPILLVHSEQANLPWLEEHLMRLIQSIKAESDEITNRFANVGTRVSNAYMSQGLHELHRSYCSRFRCLECAIGKAIIR